MDAMTPRMTPHVIPALYPPPDLRPGETEARRVAHRRRKHQDQRDGEHDAVVDEHAHPLGRPLEGEVPYRSRTAPGREEDHDAQEDRGDDYRRGVIGPSVKLVHRPPSLPAARCPRVRVGVPAGALCAGSRQLFPDELHDDLAASGAVVEVHKYDLLPGP